MSKALTALGYQTITGFFINGCTDMVGPKCVLLSDVPDTISVQRTSHIR